MGRPPRVQLIGAVLLSVPIALSIGLCIRIALGAALARQGNVTGLARAVRLDSQAAEYHRKLGALLISPWSPEHDQVTGTREVGKAVALSPRDPENWSASAKVALLTGDVTEMELGMRRAIALAPNNPKYYWEAANLFLSTDRPHMAVPMMRDFLMLSPSDAVPAMKACASAMPLEQVWSELIRDHGTAKQVSQFAAFAAENGEVSLALRAWRAALARSSTPSLESGQILVETLLHYRLYEHAHEVWNDLVKPDSENLVFNGRFNEVLSGWGFDWRTPNVEGISLTQESDNSRAQTALRIEFATQNAAMEPIYQLVLVESSTEYVLKALVRSEDIRSESGPRLRVMDADDDTAYLAVSEPTTGTSSWHEVRLNISSSPSTRLLRISVWRPKGRTYPQEISGTFWIRDVALTRVSKPDLRP